MVSSSLVVGPAAQAGSNARQQLLQAEGLGDVVVGAHFEGADLVIFLGRFTQGNDQDIVRQTHLAQQLEAEFAVEVQIDDDQREILGGQKIQCLFGGVRG